MTPALTSVVLISAVAFAISTAHSTPTEQRPSDGNIGITATGDTGTLSFGNGIRITAINNEPTDAEAKTSTSSASTSILSLTSSSQTSPINNTLSVGTTPHIVANLTSASLSTSNLPPKSLSTSGVSRSISRAKVSIAGPVIVLGLVTVML